MFGSVVYTVSQINNYVKQKLDGDTKLQGILISGEISNFKGNYSSGHLYFSLKDDKAALSCVMFSSSASRLRFKPENGMKVIVLGKVSVYPASGQYQLYADSMQPDGKGETALAFEQLKEKLSKEGLFDESHKKALPIMPQRIGVVTSATGAVIEDIKKVTARRCPLSEIILYPSAVQGENAPEQLIRGVKYFSERKNVNVIIIGRGGGSAEDLFCFNDEKLIRTIYDCTIPIISAVGHETDFTLCDFAADKRAATPSMAAELAVPSNEEMRTEIDGYLKRIRSAAESVISVSYQNIDRLNDRLSAHSPEKQVENELLSIKLIDAKMSSVIKNRLALESAQITALADKLNVLSPIRLLQKGYSISTKQTPAGAVNIDSVARLQKGDKISIRYADGHADCTVDKIKKAEV